MTQDEQKQFDHLQEQLDNARRNTEDIRNYFSSVLSRLHCEARLYRNLFWFLLFLGLIMTMIHYLHR